MTAREDRALAELVSEMIAEGLVRREDQTIVCGTDDDRFMIELKVLDITEGNGHEVHSGGTGARASKGGGARADRLFARAGAGAGRRARTFFRGNADRFDPGAGSISPGG